MKKRLFLYSRFFLAPSIAWASISIQLFKRHIEAMQARKCDAHQGPIGLVFYNQP
jgi:hypothetical protein